MHAIFLNIIEIIGYFLPAILGIIPISKTYEPICMNAIGICTFCVISFSNNDNIIESDKLNWFFGYLGALSLPIYVFHPVILILIDYI